MNKILLIVFALTSLLFSQWEPVNSPKKPEINAVLKMDNALFIGTGGLYSPGAVYRSFNNGQTWEMLTNLPADFPIRDIASNNDYLFVGIRFNGMFRSSDYGNSWQQINNGLSHDQKMVRAICTYGDTIFFGTQMHGIFKSTNNGDSWTSINNGLSGLSLRITDIDIDNGWLYAATESGIYKSSNGGENWTATHIPNYVYSILAANNYVYAGRYEDILVSSDFGNTWHSTIGYGGAYSLSKHNDLLFKGSYEKIHYSTDNGQTWIQLSNGIPQNVNITSLHTDGQSIIAGATGLYKSDNFGNSFYPTLNGVGIATITNWGENNDYTFISDIFSIYRSNGNEWESLTNVINYSGFTDIHTINEKVFLGTQNTSIQYSSDNGLNWNTYTAPRPRSIGLLQNKLFMFGYFVGSGDYAMYRSDDYASNWNLVTSYNSLPVLEFYSTVNKIFAAGYAGVFVSSDYGATWDTKNNGFLSNKSIDRITGSGNFIYTNDYINRKIYRSSNLGDNWEEIFTYQNSIGSIAANNNFVAVGTFNGGIHISSDYGSTWSLINEGLPKKSDGKFFNISSLFFKDGHLYSGYTNFGIWKYPLNALPVELASFTAEVNGNRILLKWSTSTETNNKGFEIERQLNDAEWKTIGFVKGTGTSTETREYFYSDNAYVKAINLKYRLKQIDFNGNYEYSDEINVELKNDFKFSLAQNYPNPFNPVTKIKYSIGTASQTGNVPVSIKVFDILGNEIATLVNEQKEPGFYEIQWDASELSSGIYFYTLKAGNFTSTKKLILMK